MPLYVRRDNILELNVDAVVNPTDYKMSGSGSIDKLIHDAGGAELKNELDSIGHTCDFGDVRFTNAYNLKCKYIIHTCAELNKDTNMDGYLDNKLNIIRDCYKRSLEEALKNELQSIAFPLIGTGSFRNPIDKTILLAINIFNEFLIENNMDIYLVLYSDKAYKIACRIIPQENIEIGKDFIFINQESFSWDSNAAANFYDDKGIPYESSHKETKKKEENVDTRTFGQIFSEFAENKKIKHSAIAKKVNIDAPHMSRIINGVNLPKKYLAIELCIAAGFTYNETNYLINRLGYAFSDCIPTDLAYKECLIKQIRGSAMYKVFLKYPEAKKWEKPTSTKWDSK